MPARSQLGYIGIETNIKVIMASLTTWEAHHISCTFYSTALWAGGVLSYQSGRSGCQILRNAYVAGAVAGIRSHVAAIVWVSRPALNPPHHKSTPAARQTESDPAPTTLFPLFISEWSLSALALHRCPPWHPIVARLDPRSWPALTLTPRAWSALALNRGPPWLPIVVRLGPRFCPPWPAMGVHSEIPSRNNAVQSVRSRRRHFWHQMSQEPSLGFEPTSLPLSESAVQHSTHRAISVLRQRGRQSLTRRLPHIYLWNR